jgi:two-component system LytT family response regulator
MYKIKCIIIEDEPLAVKVLKDYISEVPFLELQETFKDAILASDYLRHTSVDLIFLDIHLPKLKGMSFLRTLANPPAVIITTAYHQYAVEGFDLNVTDYLLKPFDFERFLVAVSKVRTGQSVHPVQSVHLVQPEKSGDVEPRDFFFLTVQKKKVKIFFSDIIYIESQREYIKVVTVGSEYVSKMSTHEIEGILPGHLFKRVHRSFIISIRRIESYTAEMIQMNGVAIPIGKGYRDGMADL